jgi:hypothetical protein
VKLDSRRHGQRFLWTARPNPPYVRFQKVSSRRFLAWVVVADDLDIDDFDRALGNGAVPEGIVRTLIRFAGYHLSPQEDELLARYRARDTGADFWAAVEAAGLSYEPPGESQVEPQPRRSAVPIPLSTAGPFVALTKALTRTSPDDWVVAPGDGARESRVGFADFRVQLSSHATHVVQADRLAGGDARLHDDLAEILARYGGQKASLTAQACTQLAARRPGESIGFDEILHELAYKRPPGRVDGREHRRAAKRDAYARIVLGHWATAVGDVKRTVDGRTGGFEAWTLYAIDHVSFEADGTPAAITLLPAGLSRLIAENPAFLEYLGNVRDVLALPDTIAGRWAASVLYALRLHWRLNVRSAALRTNTGGERQVLEFPSIARRQLLELMQPDPPTPADVLAGRDPRRAITCFEDAMRILRGRRRGGEATSVHVSYWRGLPTPRRHDGLEPWDLTAPGSKPRVSHWREPWLNQRLDVRPGGDDLAELLELRERSRAAQRGLRKGQRQRVAGASRAETALVDCTPGTMPLPDRTVPGLERAKGGL